MQGAPQPRTLSRIDGSAHQCEASPCEIECPGSVRKVASYRVNDCISGPASLARYFGTIHIIIYWPCAGDSSRGSGLLTTMAPTRSRFGTFITASLGFYLEAGTQGGDVSEHMDERISDNDAAKTQEQTRRAEKSTSGISSTVSPATLELCSDVERMNGELDLVRG